MKNYFQRSSPKPIRVRHEIPDLQTQLETLLDTVWRWESWERRHPLTVAALRGNGAVNRCCTVKFPEESAA